MPDALVATLGDLITGAMLVGLAVALGLAVRELGRLHRRRLDVVRRNTPQPRHAATSNVRIIPAQRAR